MKQSLVLALLFLPPALGVGRLASTAKFTDALSLLSKLNSNPYALSDATASKPIALSQAGSHAGAAAVGGDESALAALASLGGGQTATAGSDDAADAVSDSIKNLFNLDDQAPAATAKAAAPKPEAPKAAPTIAKAAVVPKKVKTPPPAVKPVRVPASTKVTLPKHSTIAAISAKPTVVKKQAAPMKAVAPKVVKAAVAATKKVVTPPPAVKPVRVPAKTTVKLPEHPSIALPKAKPTVVKTKAAPTRKQQKAAAVKAAVKTVKKEPEQVKELEAEVSALKAKLATTPAPVVKPMKATPAQAAHPHTAPVAVPPAAAKANVKSALSTKAVVGKGMGRDTDFADLDADFDESFAPPVKAPVKASHPAVKDEKAPAPVVAALASKAASPVEVPTAAPPAADPPVMTMTMVPQAVAVAVAVAPAPIVTEAVSGTQPVSFFGSIEHFFHRALMGADPAPAPLPTVAPPPDPDAGRPAFSKQDIDRTALSASMDGLSDVAIADEFSRKEDEDVALIDQVKREDRALRVDAETPKRPAMPAPANFKHDAGSTHISSFWGTLAEEDADIEDALAKDGDDLSEYERLKTLQDAKVESSVSEIAGPLGEHMAIERRALRKAASSA